MKQNKDTVLSIVDITDIEPHDTRKVMAEKMGWGIGKFAMAYDRSLLALKLKALFAERAKENQGTRTDIFQNSEISNVDTKKELANIAGVSHDTI